jgi:hypothetical protein
MEMNGQLQAMPTLIPEKNADFSQIIALPSISMLKFYIEFHSTMLGNKDIF